MYCRKCGNQIPDDSVFCLKCGEKVVEADLQPNRIFDELVSRPDDTLTGTGSNEHNSKSVESESPAKPNFRFVAIAIGVIAVFVILFSIINESRRCSFSSCENIKAENSKYCREHTCEYEDCNSSKTKNDTYCYHHELELCCSEDDCDSLKVTGGEYCYAHTCKNANCLEARFWDTDYCWDHQISMRERLTNSSFFFSLNSAGGIVFSFNATNSTGKEIKYVRFEVELYNAVGDRAYDEIKDTSTVDVEIIGPVKAGKEVSLSKEIIGYCDNCAKIQINDITIVYTDGTSETGSFNYYYEK